MFRLRYAVILLAMAPGCAFAQRHSGDTERGYYKKPPNPILNIDDQATKTWSHPRLSDLMKMKRVTVDVPDLTMKQQAAYEGVSLIDIAPTSPGRRVDVFENTLAFRDRLVVSSTDLDMRSEVIVAYSKNGKNLAEHPFCLAATNEHGGWVLIRNLSYIRLGKTP
jgi:hypothetical protein